MRVSDFFAGFTCSFSFRDVIGTLCALAAASYLGGLRAGALLAAGTGIVAFAQFARGRKNPSQRKFIVGVGLLSITGWYAEAKYGFFSAASSSVPSSTVVIGASYILVRAIILLLDTLRPEQKGTSPIEDLHYLVFLPALASGPIQRRNAFVCTSPFTSLKRHAVPCLARMVWGLTKIFALAPLMAEPALNFDRVQSWPHAYINIFVSLCYFTIYLYLNFSGTIDIVNSISRLLGYDLPENFDRPYAARSISDFWSRWHMSLTSFLRDYAFRPTVAALALHSGKPQVRSQTISYLGYYVVFLLSALWHNFSLNFLLWGAWHATGMVVADRYGGVVLDRLGSGFLRFAAGWSMTAIFVAVGWIFFVYPTPWILAKAYYAPNTEVVIYEADRPTAHFVARFTCPNLAETGRVEFRQAGTKVWKLTPAPSRSGHAYTAIIREDRDSDLGPRLQPRMFYEFRLSCILGERLLYSYTRFAQHILMPL